MGVALMVLNLVAALWGTVAWAAKRASVSFWYVLRVAQLAVVASVVLGLVRLAAGAAPSDKLHYVYGVAPLVIAVVTEAMRAGAAAREVAEVEGDAEALPHREKVLLARRVVVREIGIMTVGVILVVTLLLRAMQSG